MKPLTSHPLPYQLELMLLPSSLEQFSADARADNLFGYESSLISVYAYKDVFIDTPNADLHAAAQLLRSRHFVNEPDAEAYKNGVHLLHFEQKPHSLEFKGTPFYMHQFFLSRKYGYASAESSEQVQRYLSSQEPSEPIQMLYQERPDLVGFPLSMKGCSKVIVFLKRLLNQKREPIVDLAFHEYALEVGTEKISTGQLVEIQPNFVSGNNIERFLPYFRFVAQKLIDQGYEISPVGKYQRVPRAVLDRLPHSSVYGIKLAPRSNSSHTNSTKFVESAAGKSAVVSFGTKPVPADTN